MEKKNFFLNLAVTEGHFVAFTIKLFVLSINGIVIHEFPLVQYDYYSYMTLLLEYSSTSTAAVALVPVLYVDFIECRF
jgi:hypothetical protein